MEENRLIDVLDRLSPTRTPEDLWQEAIRIFSDSGSDWITFGSVFPGDLPIIQTSVSASLMSDYMALGLHRADPWLVYCARSALVDNLVVGSARSGDIGYPVQQVFEGHGILRASLFPCSQMSEAAGIVVYARSRDSTQWLASSSGRAHLQLLVALVSSRLRPYRLDENNPGRYGRARYLSPRETDVLRWLAQGHDTDAIAAKMNLASVTVSKHLASARKRLGARTREQALAIALTSGLIHL